MRYLRLTTLLCFIVLASPLAANEPIVLRAAPLSLDERDPALTQIDQLIWRGGLSLKSDHPNFGGISGLETGQDGTLIAIIDLGWRVDLLPTFGADGNLRDLEILRFERLTNQTGTPLSGKSRTDAESLTWTTEGSLVIGFERNHRLESLSGLRVGPALETPADLRAAPNNGGLEAITTLGSGDLLIITEEMSGNAGWRGRPGDWQAITYPVSGGFKPTGATTLPNGDVVVVERFYTPLAGVACRFRLIERSVAESATEITGTILATLRPPLAVDNLEAITTMIVNDEPLLMVMSDDNLNRRTQRNLLLAFEIAP